MSRIIAIGGLLVLILAACGTSIPERTTPTPPPSPTPTAQPTPLPDLSAFVGVRGFPLVMNETVGDIPAEARVGIVSADSETTYTLITEDGRLAFGVNASQVRIADGFVVGEPTPAPIFQSLQNADGYPLVTRINVGAIAADERVRITSIRLGADGWLYTIVPDDEQRFEEALERALEVAD